MSLMLRTAFPLLKRMRQCFRDTREAFFRARYPTISKPEFIYDLKTAIEHNTGYAAGKIGFSEQHWMYYEILMQKERSRAKIRQFERDLKFHALKQEGVFPDDLRFYLDFNRFMLPHVRNIDCLGICYRPWELELIRYYG